MVLGFGFFLAVVIVLLALLPIAFIVTVLTWPLWSWIENTLHIEAMGHSGPAEWCFLVVYVLCIAIAGCFYKKIIFLAAGSMLIVILLMLMPLPHGGSIGEAVMHEFSQSFIAFREIKLKTTQTKIQQRSASQALKDHLAERFSGSLEFNRNFTQDHWQSGTVLGQKAWLDSHTGIIWGSKQDSFLPGWSQADLQTAITFCRHVQPPGYWSLATNAEYALGVKGNMQDYITDIAGRWIAQSYSLGGIKPMPSLVGFGSSPGSNEYHQRSTQVLIRCVGRGNNAPLQGYTRDDISNDDVLKLLIR